MYCRHPGNLGLMLCKIGDREAMGRMERMQIYKIVFLKCECTNLIFLGAAMAHLYLKISRCRAVLNIQCATKTSVFAVPSLEIIKLVSLEKY